LEETFAERGLGIDSVKTFVESVRAEQNKMMFCRRRFILPRLSESKPFAVEIEVHAGWGNTDKIAVVGLPDTAAKRVRTGLPLPSVTTEWALHIGVKRSRVDLYSDVQPDKCFSASSLPRRSAGRYKAICWLAIKDEKGTVSGALSISV
jgi:hypothetical protein